MATDAYVGIGSNVDPERNLRAALAALRDAFGPLRESPIYRNPAVGFDGDDFLNCVVAFATEASLEHVIATLADIEQRHGRDRAAARWGPRTLDLDLLLYGELVSDRPKLPRGDVLRHAFVLRPLAELAPDALHPETGRSFAAHWRAFNGERKGMRRVTLPEPAAVSMSKT